MTCLLNEEILAIKNLMSHLRRAIPLESNLGRKKELEDMYEECQRELEQRLDQTGDLI